MASQTHKINGETFTVGELVRVNEPVKEDSWNGRIESFRKDSGNVVLRYADMGSSIWRDEKLISKLK